MFLLRFRSSSAALTLLSLVAAMLVVCVSRPAAAQGSQWLSVSTGERHTCGIKTNNTLWCWGSNQYGQLGVGDTAWRNVPTRVGSNAHWRTVTAGTSHTCALRNDGERFCWGRNNSGQLGFSGGNRLSPIRRLNEGAWDQISAGHNHTCGIRADGELRCWGDNFFGQLGVGDTADRNVPVVPSPAKGWTSITAGLYHTCGIRYRLRWCWGWNVLGQLGQAQSATERHVPYRLIEAGLSWSTSSEAISAGANHTCAVGSSDGITRLYCWGYNSSGQLGLGDFTNRFVPTAITSTPVVAMAGGTHHSCFIRGDGRRACAGANSYGQLGTNDTIQRKSWTLVNDSVTWRSIAAGTDHTCAISTGNALYCWGSNDGGKLGIGSGSYRLVPTQVLN